MRGNGEEILYAKSRTSTAATTVQREQEQRRRHRRRHELYLQMPEISRSLIGRINRSGYIADSLPTEKLIEAIYAYDGDENRIYDHLLESGLLTARDPMKIYA